MEALYVQHDGVHGLLRVVLVDAVGVLEEEALIVQRGEGIQFRGVDEPFPFVGAAGVFQALHQKHDDRQGGGDDHKNDGGAVFLDEFQHRHLIVPIRIGGDHGVHIGAGDQADGFVQDGIQLVAAPAQGEGLGHGFAGGHGGQAVLIHNGIVLKHAGIAEQTAVGFPAPHGPQAFLGAAVMHDLPVGVIILDEHLAAHVAHNDGHGGFRPGQGALTIRVFHHGVQFRPHEGGGDDQALFLRVEGA